MLGQTPHCMSTFVHADRKGGFYSSSLFIRHGVAILEDLLITLADGIASMYLELISVDSSLTNEMNNLGLSLCTLSTRSLQRLRNEVLFYTFSFLMFLPFWFCMYELIMFILSVSGIRNSMHYTKFPQCTYI